MIDKILLEIPEIHQIDQDSCNLELYSLLMDCVNSLGIVGQTPPTGDICWLDKVCEI